MRQLLWQGTSLESQRILRTFRLVATGYGALSFVAAAVLGFLAGDAATTTAKVVLLLVLIVALISMRIPDERVAWTLLLATMWAAYIWLVAVGPGGATAWLPLGLLSSAVIFTTASVASTSVALLGILAFAVTQLIVLADPLPHLRVGASVLHGIPVLLVFQIALAFGITGSQRAIVRYARDVDVRSKYTEDLAAAESTLETQRMDRLRATQRLHETVLNTLRALGRSEDGTQRDLAERCAEDLAVLDNWQFEGRPHTVKEVVVSSVAAVDLNTVQVSIREDRDLTLSADTAEAIRLMLTELLINVSRHARATAVTVGWSVLDDRRLIFTVEDNGIGISNKESGRIGIRRLVRETAATLDGQVLIADRPGGGTVITLRIRLRAPGVNPGVAQASGNLPSAVIRILSQAALIWAIVISPIIVIDLEKPVLVGASSMIAALTMFLAITLREIPSNALLLGSLTLAIGNLFLASALSASCTSASSVQWLMNIFVVMTSTAFAFGSSQTRVLTTISALITPVALLFTMPSDCLDYVWMPALSIVAILPLVVTIARRGLGEGRPLENTDELDNLLNEQLRRERQADERRLRWASALDRSRSVMTQLAYSGQVDGPLRQQAEVADAQLRGQLLIEPEEDGALAAFALRIIDEAAERGVAVKAEVLNVSGRQDPLPEIAVSEIRQVLERAQGEAQLKLFVVGKEESLTLLVPIVPGSMPMFADGTPAEGIVERQYGDLRVEFEPQDHDAHGHVLLWVSATRQLQ